MINDANDLLERRKAAFPRFMAEADPALDDFLERVGLPPTCAKGFNFRRCAEGLGGWLRGQNIPKEGKAWVASSVGYFIGAYFINQYEGRWLVSEIPNSPFFGRYVIGFLPQSNHPTSMIDPMQMAADYIDAPIGRDLLMLLKEVESTLVCHAN